MNENDIQDAAKEKYAAAARQVASGKAACCGGGAPRGGCDPISGDL